MTVRETLTEKQHTLRTLAKEFDAKGNAVTADDTERLRSLVNEVEDLRDQLGGLDPPDQIFKSIVHNLQRRETAEAEVFMKQLSGDGTRSAGGHDSGNLSGLTFTVEQLADLQKV